MNAQALFLSLDGRIGRQSFWIGTIAIAAVTLVGYLISPILGILIALAGIYPGICVQGKRWHDRGKSAWWCLIGLVPFVGALWTLVECGCLPGDPVPNQFGTQPLPALSIG